MPSMLECNLAIHERYNKRILNSPPDIKMNTKYTAHNCVYQRLRKQMVNRQAMRATPTGSIINCFF